MATSASTVDFLLDQLSGAGAVSVRKMFGEYCLYLDGKPVALVCDDQLFVKPTDAGRALLDGNAAEGVPYPGAKPYLLIDGDYWEERDALCGLIRTTAAALPLPKPRKPRAAKT